MEHMRNTSSIQMFLDISTGQEGHVAWSLHRLILPPQILHSCGGCFKDQVYWSHLPQTLDEIWCTDSSNYCHGQYQTDWPLAALHKVTTQHNCDTTKFDGEIMSATVNLTTYFLWHSLLRYDCSEVQPNLEKPLYNLFVLQLTMKHTRVPIPQLNKLHVILECCIGYNI